MRLRNVSSGLLQRKRKTSQLSCELRSGGAVARIGVFLAPRSR